MSSKAESSAVRKPQSAAAPAAKTPARRTRAAKPAPEMVIRRAICDECGALESMEVAKDSVLAETHRFSPCAYCGYWTSHALLLDESDPEHGKLEALLQAEYEEQRAGIQERLSEIAALGADVREYADDESPKSALSVTRYLDDDSWLVKHRIFAEPHQNAMDMLAQVVDRLSNPDKGHIWFVRWEGEDDDVPTVNVAWTRGKEVDD